MFARARARSKRRPSCCLSDRPRRKECSMRRRLILLGAACGLTLLLTVPAQAQLNGSHSLGDFGVQAGSQPAPGFYAALFYVRYDTDTIKDADGNTVRLSPDSPASSGLTAAAPLLWYVSKAKVLGANYGVMAVLPWANASIEAPAFGVQRHSRHELRRHSRPAARPGMAREARGRLRRVPVLYADGAIRARWQRQHREGHVDIRTLPRDDALFR